jgi:hypothetical protein
MRRVRPRARPAARDRQSVGERRAPPARSSAHRKIDRRRRHSRRLVRPAFPRGGRMNTAPARLEGVRRARQRKGPMRAGAVGTKAFNRAAAALIHPASCEARPWSGVAALQGQTVQRRDAARLSPDPVHPHPCALRPVPTRTRLWGIKVPHCARALVRCRGAGASVYGVSTNLSTVKSLIGNDKRAVLTLLTLLTGVSRDARVHTGAGARGRAHAGGKRASTASTASTSLSLSLKGYINQRVREIAFVDMAVDTRNATVSARSGCAARAVFFGGSNV